jgi:hypothetical protein
MSNHIWMPSAVQYHFSSNHEKGIQLYKSARQKPPWTLCSGCMCICVSAGGFRRSCLRLSKQVNMSSYPRTIPLASAVRGGPTWCVYACVRVYMCVCECVCVCVCVRALVYVCVCAHVYVCMHVHFCIRVCALLCSELESSENQKTYNGIKMSLIRSILSSCYLYVARCQHSYNTAGTLFTTQNIVFGGCGQPIPLK